MAEPRRELVVVYWEDPSSRTTWHTSAEMREWLGTSSIWHCMTVGWVLEDNDQFIALAAQKTQDREHWDFIMRIPKGVVTRVVPLTAHLPENH